MRLASPIAVRVLAVLLALVLAAPVGLGLALTDPAKRSRELNRPLIDLPAPSRLTEAPREAVAQAIDYLGDRALGVIAAARGLSMLRHEVLGDPASPNLLRSGPLVFLTDHNLDGERRFAAITAACRTGAVDAPWVIELERRVRLAARAAKGPGRRVGFLAVPSKPVLYADRLPPAVPPALRRTCERAAERRPWAARLHRLARAEGVTFVYPWARFVARRDAPTFYPMGNFHADGEAAHVAAWSLLQRMYPGEFHIGGPGFREVEAYADMAAIFLYARRHAENRPTYGSLRPVRVAAREAALKARYPGLPGLRVYRTPRVDRGRRALIIGNSFSLHLADHVATGFDETVLVYTNAIRVPAMRRVFTDLIPDLDPDAVIFLYHDAGYKRTANALRLMALALEPEG